MFIQCISINFGYLQPCSYYSRETLSESIMLIVHQPFAIINTASQLNIPSQSG